uniref:Minor capsid protein VP2 n=1 Tax=Feline calicivirus TaxID=11978 RepID=Q66876_FCV|nr:nucleic acid binding protein [Feline calicivirus]
MNSILGLIDTVTNTIGKAQQIELDKAALGQQRDWALRRMNLDQQGLNNQVEQFTQILEQRGQGPIQSVRLARAAGFRVDPYSNANPNFYGDRLNAIRLSYRNLFKN